MKKRNRVLMILGVFIGLVGLTAIALAMTQSIVLASLNTNNSTPSQTVTIPTGPFDPASYGIPATIAGYKVLAVISSENTACVPTGTKRLVLQAIQQNEMDFLTRMPSDTLTEEIERLSLKGFTKDVMWAGPNITSEEIISEMKNSNQGFVKSGYCIHSSQIVEVTETPKTK